MRGFGSLNGAGKTAVSMVGSEVGQLCELLTKEQPAELARIRRPGPSVMDYLMRVADVLTDGSTDDRPNGRDSSCGLYRAKNSMQGS